MFPFPEEPLPQDDFGEITDLVALCGRQYHEDDDRVRLPACPIISRNLYYCASARPEKAPMSGCASGHMGLDPSAAQQNEARARLDIVMPDYSSLEL
jgi:hypothetical protein